MKCVLLWSTERNSATVAVFITVLFFFLPSQLFLFLQDFSQRMLSKTHEIEKQLDSLIRDTKATDSCLHSVFNDFLMLSNTQFIENVMYIIETFFVLLQFQTVQSVRSGNKKVFFLCVLLQRVYDEEVEETVPKAEALEKQPEQV